MTKKTELYLLLLILIASVFLRFYQLGYSHFYGDEIKTLYLRKDVSAFNFLMNQRKGPGQFVASWAMEKVSGGYSELWIRFPYAVVGTLLIFVFYYFVRQNFGTAAALYSSIFFSLSGFNIAFSRTAQYQVLYVLFGFLCLIFAKFYHDSKKTWTLLTPILFLSLALLSHYDALFFLVPLFFIVNKKDFLKIALSGLFICLIFYLPNLLLGFFDSNTFGYISKRLIGENYLKNNSLYTISAYNPLYLYPVLLSLLATVGFVKLKNDSKNMLLAWFLVPFVVFQFFILNPGTHVHNYLLPLTVLSGLGANYLLSVSLKLKPFVLLVFSIFFGLIFCLQLWVYVPALNTGYPWRNTSFLGINTDRVGNDYHLYLYGFPYYRGWDKIGEYMSAIKGVRSFYTNDNETVAEYYFGGAPHIASGSNFLPQYYIQIDSPQELKQKPELPLVDQYDVVLEEDLNKVKIFKLKPVSIKTTL